MAANVLGVNDGPELTAGERRGVPPAEAADEREDFNAAGRVPRHVIGRAAGGGVYERTRALDDEPDEREDTITDGISRQRYEAPGARP